MDNINKENGVDDLPLETQEERIKWLRERGVEIDLKSDSKSETHSDIISGEVYIVKIPCDENLPCEEILIPLFNKSGDQLLNYLQSRFSTAYCDLDESLLKETSSKQFGTNDISVNPKVLNELGKKGSVEVFKISHPSPENMFCRVSFYLDEIGQLKHLPSNNRAMKFANLTGYQSVPFVGDIFVGRVEVLPNKEIKNTNFRLSEMNPDALWMKDIVSRNYQHGIATNQVAMDSEDSCKGENLEVGYKWCESTDEIELSYPLPVGIVSKEIAVKFSPQLLLVTLKQGQGQGQGGQDLLRVPLYGKVSIDGCCWSCVSVKGGGGLPQQLQLDITLEKEKAGLWKRLEKTG